MSIKKLGPIYNVFSDSYHLQGTARPVLGMWSFMGNSHYLIHWKKTTEDAGYLRNSKPLFSQ